MGNNYKFEHNPDRLSREQIEKHMDFDALLEKFEQTPPLKLKKSGRILRLASIGGAVAASLALLWFFSVVNPTQTENSKSASAYFAKQPFVHPPIEDVQPSFASFEIDAQDGGEILYATGSKMVIPRQAFRNDRGQMIEGEVSIRFRELTDYIDFFLSGIPMHYDSLGVQYQFESAGMLEIYAEQDGELVQLAPGKSIEVVLFSEIMVSDLDEKPQFNVYHLDTIARNWVYAGLDNIEFLDEIKIDDADPLANFKKDLLAQLNNIEQKKKAALRELEASIPQPKRPLRPFPNDPNLPTFELEFPAELASSEAAALYQGTLWQLSPNNAPFDESLFGAYQWDIEGIEKINNQEYEIVLKAPEHILRILATPVLIGSDYDQAMAQFQLDMEAYEQSQAERENKLQIQRDAITAWSEDQRKEAIAFYESNIEKSAFVNLSPSDVFRRKVANRFTIDRLGVWNCDRPIRTNKTNITPKLVDQNGTSYQNVTAYVVDRAHNTVYRYYAGKKSPIKLDLEAENLLWVVTQEEKIALFRTQEVDVNKEEIMLTLLEEDIENEEEVRKALAF